jgi:hypothetical protein
MDKENNVELIHRKEYIQPQVCSEEQYENIKNKAKTNYKLKNPKESFVKGQKYYVLDKNVPNCVNSVLCEQTFANKDTTTFIDNDLNKHETTFSEPKCFSNNAYYTTGTEKKQLYTLADKYVNGIYDKFNTTIANRRHNKYQLPTTTPDIYYRKCPIFGCKSGTSLIGGRKTKRKTRKRSRK